MTPYTETARIYDLPTLTQWVGRIEGHLSALAEHVLIVDRRTEQQVEEQRKERMLALEAIASTKLRDLVLVVVLSASTSTMVTCGVVYLIGSVNGWF